MRFALILACWMFVRLDQNPLVRLEAVLGLSPSPLERLFGIRGPFSGMTEATYQLAHGHVGASLAANVLTIPFWAAVLAMILRWSAPRIATRRGEYVALAMIVAATIINNVAPRWF